MIISNDNLTPRNQAHLVGSNQAFDFWTPNINEDPNRYINVLVISSSPFLAIIILIFIVFALISCVLKIKHRNKHNKKVNHVRVSEDCLEFANSSVINADEEENIKRKKDQASAV